MKSTLFGGTFKVLNMAGLVIVLLPLLAQAAINRWASASDGAWETAGSWSLGTAPSSADNRIYFTNAVSKTVTINSSTPSGTLVVSNLFIEAPSGATNTLVLSGNTTPLVCVSAAAGAPLTLGENPNKAGALVVDGGSLVTTNDAGDSVTYVGNLGVGIMTVSNGMWQGNQLNVGFNNGANGTLNLIGGTNAFSYTNNSGIMYVGNVAGSTGTVNKIGGLLVTTNGTWAVGYNGMGTMTASGGVWQGYALRVSRNSRLDLIGGTNGFKNNWILNSGAPGTTTVTVTGGMLSNLNVTVGQNNTNSLAEMTVSNATYICGGGIALGGNPISSAPWRQQSVLSIVDSLVTAGGMEVADYGTATLNLTRGTNIFNTGFGVLCGNTVAGSTGTVWMTGGLLVTTNCSIANVGYTAGSLGRMTMSNGIWIAKAIQVAPQNGGSGNSLTVSGGQVWITDNGGQFTTVGNNTGSNNVLLITDGALWDVAAGALGGVQTGGPGNVITNAGGIFQFARIDPGITTGTVGSVVLNSGTISFRAVTTVDVRENQTGTRLSKITFSVGGTNAFRLNNATNATSPSQNYTFAANMGSTNYAGLQLVNGNTCYRGGKATIGAGGSILFSNTVAVVSNLTLNAVGAALTMVDSTVTNIGALVLGEDSVITINSNSVMNVGGALSVPTNATFTLTGGIDRNGQVTLFNAASIGGAGSSANWTVSPATHRVRVVGNSLVIAPRGAGFIIKVQ